MGELKVDADFPGGNIIVDGMEGDRVRLHQDQRDTLAGKWFYWYFRVTGAEGRTVEFVFPENNAIGVRGPGVSLDKGLTWSWMGSLGHAPVSFRYQFPPDATEVRFSVAMPYTESSLRRFLNRYADNPHIKSEILAKSRKGRDVEMVRLGRLDGGCRHRVLLTARHHALEMMPNYVHEGIMEAILADDEDGRWFRENAEFLVIPFVDKDGVEDGDQGKNRPPHDHEVDYHPETGIYPEPRALRNFVEPWSEGRLHFILDLHSPYIRDDINEHVHCTAIKDNGNWERFQLFSDAFIRHRIGPVPFDPALGTGVDAAFIEERQKKEGVSWVLYWAWSLMNTGFALSMEFPYANAGGVEVNATTARLFGRDLTSAIRALLMGI